MDPSLGEIPDKEEEALAAPRLAAQRAPARRAHRAQRDMVATGYPLEYHRQLSNNTFGFSNEAEYEECFPIVQSHIYDQIIQWPRRCAMLPPHPAIRRRWSNFLYL